MQRNDIVKRIISIAVPLLFLVGITLISSFLYLQPGIATGDDYTFHLGNIYDAYYGMKNGLSIDSSNHNMMGIYAYNTHLFYAPFPHYFAALVMLIFNASSIDAVKITVTIFCFIASLFFYLFAKKVSKSTTVSLLGAAFFIFCPYRMFCGYCRFAYAETIAISLIPVLFYGIYSFTHDDKPTYRTFLAIILGVSGLILSHPFTALSSVILALIYMALHYKNIWNTIKTKKGIILSCVTVVMIFSLIGFYFFPMLQANSSNLYRVSNDEAMWTTYEHVKNSTGTSANFSGFLNIDWIKGRIASDRWPADQPLYVYLVELFILVASWAALALSDFLSKKYLKNKYLILAITIVSFWLLPLTFVWLIKDVVFYFALILVQAIYLINKYLEEKHEIDMDNNNSFVTIHKPILMDIIFLLVMTIIYILLIFVGQLWHLLPSFFYTCQFAWRLWAMVTITMSWLFVIFLDLAIKSKRRLMYITPLLIIPSLLMIGTMSFREKGVALNYPEAKGYILYKFDQEEAKAVNNIGVMNEYMPQIYYENNYKSEYSNSLYATIKSTIGYHNKYVFTKEDYISPAFLTGDGLLTCSELNIPNVVFEGKVIEDGIVQLPQFYYDGYQISLVDKQTNQVSNAVVTNIDGLVSFAVSKGEYTINVNYVGPTSRRVFNVVFYFGVAGIVGLSVLAVRELYLENKKKAEESTFDN